MNRVLWLFASVLCTSCFSLGQELGVRFGNTTAGHVAVDGVFSLGEFSRVHADVSFGNNGVGIDALWDFMYRPLSGEAFNWYAGVGPYVYFHDPVNLGVAGELGLDYRFKDIPISISGDWRPSLLLIDDTHFSANIFGFNVRYVFNK
jgi:hypothetical protein